MNINLCSVNKTFLINKKFKKVDTPRKMTDEEISKLPKAAVIWAEIRYDFGEVKSDIQVYEIIPMMVSFPGCNGMLVGSNDKNCEAIYYDIGSGLVGLESALVNIWNKKPGPDQISIGISVSMFNKMSDKTFNNIISERAAHPEQPLNDFLGKYFD